MNIFRLDDDPVLAARYHCDKHVVKMILETAMLLDTAHGAEAWRNHPCARWTRAGEANYRWLWQLGMALLAEYTHRYGKMHSWQLKMAKLEQPPVGLPAGGTPPVQVMPDEYRGPDAVEAYRRSYIATKLGFARWTNREVPPWVK